MEPHFEKANEIYFRLGIIYKQQQKFQQSLEVSCRDSYDTLNSGSRADQPPQCFKYIVQDPPRPLTEEDIWFQIGHVHEQQKDVRASRLRTRGFALTCLSTTRQRQPIGVFSTETRTTQRCYNSSDGCIISRAPVLPVRNKRSSISRNP